LKSDGVKGAGESAAEMDSSCFSTPAISLLKAAREQPERALGGNKLVVTQEEKKKDKGYTTRSLNYRRGHGRIPRESSNQPENRPVTKTHCSLSFKILYRNKNSGRDTLPEYQIRNDPGSNSWIRWQGRESGVKKNSLERIHGINALRSTASSGNEKASKYAYPLEFPDGPPSVKGEVRTLALMMAVTVNRWGPTSRSGLSPRGLFVKTERDFPQYRKKGRTLSDQREGRRIDRKSGPPAQTRRFRRGGQGSRIVAARGCQELSGYGRVGQAIFDKEAWATRNAEDNLRRFDPEECLRTRSVTSYPTARRVVESGCGF